MPVAADGLSPDRRRDAERPWYVFASRLLPAPPHAGRWIDLGCGQAEFLELATARGLAAGIGLDLARSNAKASARIGASSVVADLSRPLPFRDRSLDGASMVEVIEHVATAEALVAELARVIRPGGWLIVTTPNIAHLT